MPADAHADAFGSGLNDARWHNRVLGLQRLDHGLQIQAEVCDLTRREFKVDHLVLRADEIDLANIGHRENAGPGRLDIVAQLPLRQPIGGECIHIAIHVTEAVVVKRPDDALRQLRLHILDHVPHLDPCGAHVALFRFGAQVHVDGRLPGNGDALGVVELLQFFELLLDAVGDLVDGVLDGGAGP